MSKKITKKSLKEDDINKETTETNTEEQIVINTDYIPVQNNLIDSKTNIFDTVNDITFSQNMELPRFDLGFQHYIHQSKGRMAEYMDRKNKYKVLNSFERYIDEYEESIGNISKKYFDIEKDKPDILSRGFYKLWEILILYDLIDINNKNFISAHLAEGPGSFIQATMFFREKFSKYWKNDEYYAITLHPEDEKKNVPELEKNFVNYYSKEKPQRFILHKTYPKQVAGGNKKKDNGDLTDPKTLLLFGGDMKEKADFITADGGFDWTNEYLQEQEAYRLIFGQIVCAILNQKKKGHFVCKFFETFTMTSIKFLNILKIFYNKIEIIKPLTSRLASSEKYFICMDFKYDDTDKEYKKYTNMLLEMLKEIHKEQNLNIINIFSNYTPDNNFLNNIIKLNIEIENKQFKALNNIFTYINNNNFFGDVYQMNRQKQINASKFWTNNFFPKDNELEKNRKNLNKYFSHDQ